MTNTPPQETHGSPGIDVADRTTEQTKTPKMYVVYVHNDPFTPREFVVQVILRYFQKTTEEAVKIMERAHRQGMGAVGVYTHEIAETKVSVANKYSRAQGRPLHFSTQEQD